MVEEKKQKAKTGKARAEKNKGGRPRKEIDYQKLEPLCRIQCTGEECASVLGMTYDTLDRNLKADGHGGFKEYYKKNGNTGKASLRRLQWKSAESGNTTMLIWLGKQYLGQTDRQEIVEATQPLPLVDYRNESKRTDKKTD